MRFSKFSVFLFFAAWAFVACQEKYVNPNRNLTLEAYSDMDSSAFALNSHAIRSYIDRLMHEDSDSMMADFRARGYYAGRGNFLWIDRKGIDHRADTLLKYLEDIDRMGFSRRKFRVGQIESDLKHIRTLDFDTAANRINRVMARLEYNLTKAYLRYVTGQRFGFVNPNRLFNKLDVHDSDSVPVTYARLFDIKMELPDKAFFACALRRTHQDSIAEFLREIQPRSPFYVRLQRLLNDPGTAAIDRPKIMVNMERCRWRLKDDPEQHRKYVLVNIPAFHLQAVNGEEQLSMRVGCGTFATKTPLLTSRIKRMDINPQWIIPRSIIQKSIVQHAGDESYFESHHYFVRERRTGKNVDFSQVTHSMLMDKDYLVIQEGGEGNSLGRIIFRFDNDFSIYLHDTSSRGVFIREDRGVSHGCVRVERPFDLAVFLLPDQDQKTIGRIRYSMAADVSSIGHRHAGKKSDDEEEKPDTLDRGKLIGSLPVDPEVPVFITYFTMAADSSGQLHEYADVYGYDRIMYHSLKNYK